MEMRKEKERLEREEGLLRLEKESLRGNRAVGAGVEDDEMRPNFLWQSPCSCCRCWGHFTKAGPYANVISS